ncbi:up-regulator of cell proliferation-like [Mantella aurantiaca]
MERAPDFHPNHLQHLSKDETEEKNTFNHFMEELGLNAYTPHKLTPSDVLSINQDVFLNSPLRSIKNIPWHFLRRLMSLNANARNVTFRSSEMGQRSVPGIARQGASVVRVRSKIPIDLRKVRIGISKIPIDISKHVSEPNESSNLSDLFSRDSENELSTVHPLDVICALLHCSDSFLQQEIMTRLSMCQFAIPLLLPASDGTPITFMLWALRAIIKYLPSPTGEFVEENLVNIPMPVFSFVRLGQCKNLSKSKLLNQILSLNSHSWRKDFVHRQMGCGKGSRIISNGLVEITWYFPTKSTGSHCSQQPFAIANLRGDIQTNQRQFKLLASVSSAVFILLEGTAEFGELFNEERDKFYFILGHSSHHFRTDETKQLLKTLASSFGSRKILMGIEQNLEEKIQEIIKNTIKENPKQITLTGMAALESAFGFRTDGSQTDCQYAKLHTLELTHDILSSVKYNEECLQSLRELRVRLAKDEKEMYQLVQQGKSNKERVESELADKTQKSLLRYLWSDVITDLVYALTFMTREQKKYLLKWMWFHCHKASKNTLLEESMQGNIFYDLVHIYQAEAIIAKATQYIPRCSKLPKTAADLLLEGFPLVLISEDTLSVPIQWITDVLTDLVNKTRGPCRVRVISALGVYSTGKSSLLYAMFGLHFQIARPQHTRGALMSLIKVEDSFKKEMDCDFLLVIDTEGLRAPKLASAKERYDHDNALATFIIGISDMVIVSLSSENPSDTVNTLQIAACSLLRMRDSGRKPTLYFVQTNVTNASDGESSNKDNISEGLNETIDLVAKVVQRAMALSLNDVLKCDFSSSHWYNFIPMLWQGEPISGCINSEYAEKVMELKQHLIHTLTQESNQGSVRTMLDFTDDIKRLWDAVNLEPILRFEHIKDVITYTELSDLYRELERSLHKELYQWKSTKESQIALSHSLDTLQTDMLELLQKKKQEKIQYFRLHLDSDKKQFEEHFIEKFQSLSKELETFYKEKCTEIQMLRHGMEMAVVEDFRSQEWDPDELEPNLDFDSYWKDKVSQLKLTMLKKRDIQNEFIQILKKEMRDRGSLVTEILNRVNKLSDYTGESFTIEEKHIDVTWFTRKGARDNTKPWNRLDSITQSLIKKCGRYVMAVVKLNKDYEPIHCLDLLRMINKVIRKEAFPFTDLFEVDLKLHILRESAAAFQETHNALVEAKGEKLSLEKQRPPPLNTLKNIIEDKRRTKQFCRLCLKPAMELHVTSTLEPYVTRDVVQTVGEVRKSRRTSQILYVIKGLNLINIYNNFSPDCDVLANAISSTIAIFKRILQHHAESEHDNLNSVMPEVRSALATELSLLQRHLAEYHSKITSSNPHQFSSHVDYFIRQLINELRPNGDTIRNIILKVCERLFGCRKQNPQCTAPYDSGFRSHQRSLREFHRRSKPGKIKSVGPHAWPIEASTQRVHSNVIVKESRSQGFANRGMNHVWWRTHEERDYFGRVKPTMIQLSQPEMLLANNGGRLTFSWLGTHRQVQNLKQSRFPS